jgi:hypothetical protein
MRTFRTLFGTVTLTSPRLYHCRCQHRKTTTFRPLNLLLTEPTAPELLFMETKWASLVSYGLHHVPSMAQAFARSTARFHPPYNCSRRAGGMRGRNRPPSRQCPAISSRFFHTPTARPAR